MADLLESATQTISILMSHGIRKLTTTWDDKNLSAEAREASWTQFCKTMKDVIYANWGVTEAERRMLAEKLDLLTRFDTRKDSIGELLIKIGNGQPQY
ncbi:uncharacterized protein LOC124293324 isoform X2 [Neodiprion lecontei]|uniref:Uncharacterized protein LOC124293324 isoform X2 n=1 Tax=Neodiprion lecontei TaxID=441921 RepID=A0ABM3FNY6_NEOLC|nr:uncharacterized protein LOC124293324 isoform X2 [Neodiprion lecontei]